MSSHIISYNSIFYCNVLSNIVIIITFSTAAIIVPHQYKLITYINVIYFYSLVSDYNYLQTYKIIVNIKIVRGV